MIHLSARLWSAGARAQFPLQSHMSGVKGREKRTVTSRQRPPSCLTTVFESPVCVYVYCVMQVHEYICAFRYACTYMHIHMYVCVCVFICNYIHTRTMVFAYLSVDLSIFLPIYLIFLCLYFHTYVCMCIYRRTHTRS